jgi:site-specific DNA recombinase
MTVDEALPVVIYAVKSSPDDRESVRDQHEQVRAAIEREGGRQIVAEPFGEANASGYRGERGPQLEAAMRAAVDAAEQHGEAELWVFHSSRLARGDGRKGRRSVNLIVAQMLYENVTVRSVTDDPFVTPMLAGIAGEQAHKYAADLSAHVKRGKLQQLQRGDHLGGPLCDGYAVVREHDETGRVVGRTFRIATDRAPLVQSIFVLAAEGLSDSMIARRLNAEGARTRHGRPFTRRAIQSTVTNPWYAGRVAYKRGTSDEQIVNGKHPPLVDAAQFDRIQQMRGLRDHADRSQKVIGRPAQNHALARLAVCGKCGERLYAVTSTYRRKDGSRARSYVCHNYKLSTGVCNSKPINAEVVDAAVIAELDTLLVDFDAWLRQIEGSHTADRERLSTEVQRAEHDHDAQITKVAKVEAKWAEYVAAGDDDKADLVLPIVERERQAGVDTKRRLRAAQEAHASVPTDAPTDAMLDFANALRAAVAGRVDATGSIAEANRALRELFAEFRISEVLRIDVAEDANGELRETGTGWDIKIQPFVLPSVAHALWDSSRQTTWEGDSNLLSASEDSPSMWVYTDEPPPPLRWLSADPGPGDGTAP